MSTRLTPGATAGLFSGALFFVHAMTPYSRAWPLLWPLLGGALAVHLATRCSAARPGMLQALKLGVQSGVIAGLVYFFTTLPTLYLLEQAAFERVARALGGTGASVQLDAGVAVGLLFVSLVGATMALVGSLLALPAVRRLAHT